MDWVYAPMGFFWKELLQNVDFDTLYIMVLGDFNAVPMMDLDRSR